LSVVRLQPKTLISVVRSQLSVVPSRCTLPLFGLPVRRFDGMLSKARS
jgi:hypothetical protein